MRSILDDRGIDIVNMQLDVYNKAMKAFDDCRGLSDKGDAGPGYLQACNTAVGILAKYAFPAMAAVQIQNLNENLNDKVIDAVQIRETILNDPFAKNIISKIKETPVESLPILIPGKKDE